jgi:hypothetical protein
MISNTTGLWPDPLTPRPAGRVLEGGFGSDAVSPWQNQTFPLRTQRQK